MSGLKRIRPLWLILSVAFLAALALPAASVAAAGAPKYTVESRQAYESQLGKGEIASVGVNTEKRSLRLKLKNGTYVLYRYPAGATKKLEGELQAKGLSVERIKPHKKKKSKPLGSHPRRTIAIIIVIVLILAGVIFLLLRRRRGTARD
jgi:hypothetical protein